MPLRKSKTSHEYPYGHPRVAGEEFEVASSDVDVLLALGRIEPEAGDAKPSYARRDMVPGENGLFLDRAMVAEQGRGKRQYNRKAT